ncbi:hypothetical protein GMOD_00003037 [Pyrenophora seminiperda CCB06]|uniref:Uncharacterized protein n=1 Tax=Pyrenophora seminiperda CCB06 TaxID=1302712 RepID=A0A3M7M3L4_9PLEO|nr:hypothetical protein GMOD_00003037 [Pyrenophora seminiperda CCB06]
MYCCVLRTTLFVLPPTRRARVGLVTCPGRTRRAKTEASRERLRDAPRGRLGIGQCLDKTCNFCTAVQAPSVSLPWAWATSACTFVARPPCAVKKAASLLTSTTPRPWCWHGSNGWQCLAPAPTAAELPL